MELERVSITCYSAEFNKADQRIDRILATIEDVTGERITHYVRGIVPKRIPGNAKDLVSSWLPRATGHQRPTVLNNGMLSERSILVTLSNYPVHKIYVDSAHAGSFTLQVYPELAPRVAASLLAFVEATGAFAATMSSPKSDGQLVRTREIFTRLSALATNAQQKKHLEPQREHYRYDLDAKLLFSAAPDGRTITLPLNWQNYWSDATAVALGFPNPSLDQPLRGLYERVGDAGWHVRLTNDPLDLDVPEHLARMKWAYARFGVTQGAAA